jgi:hypothetical protein
MSYPATPGATQLDHSAQGGAGGGWPGLRGLLGDLFSESPVSLQVTGRRLLRVVAQVAAVVLGAVLLLERILVPDVGNVLGVAVASADPHRDGRRRARGLRRELQAVWCRCPACSLATPLVSPG